MIELTPKQAEYVREAHHRWNFAVGAVRSGKSHLAVQYTIPNCLRERHGERGINLILGASKENIERNVLTPMRDIWGNNMVSDINSRNWATMFGEKVYCIGAENVRQVSKLRGSEVKFCYCDEIVDINKEVFEMLKSRLSLPYSICHAAANPSYPTHFVKEFIDSKDKGVDIYCLIFPMYMDAFGTPGRETTDFAISMDYGTQNPFAALIWEKAGDVWYATRGYYYSGRDSGKQKTDAEYGEDLKRFAAPLIERRKAAQERTGQIQPKIRVIIDPSAASFIALLHQEDWCRVIPADNDVANGLRDTATALQTGLIKINPAIKDWRKEVEGYVWDESQEDRPVKENDHFMDATRYFVKTMRVTKRRSNYAPLWN